MNFHNQDDESQQPMQAHLIAIHQQRQIEHQHWYEVQMAEIKTSMENFLDELSPEQCLSFSRMVQLFIGNPQYMHVVIGQLSMLMRRVHKICTMCGDTKHSTVEHLTAEQGDMTPAPADYGWLAGLSPQEQIRKLNVREDYNVSGAFVCRNCDSGYTTLFNRASQGKDCPVCVSRARLNHETDDSKLQLGDLMFRYRVGESYTHEDGVFCLDCGTEFPVLKFRMEQGLKCPTCEVQPEVGRSE